MDNIQEDIDYIKSLFIQSPVYSVDLTEYEQEIWDNTTKTCKKTGIMLPKLYVAIRDDEYWPKNCCILRESYFDYKRFDQTKWFMDCHNYGVYVFLKK